MPMASGVLLAAPVDDPEIGDTDDDGVLQAYEFFRGDRTSRRLGCAVGV
jgi:hypothetical protein